MQVRVSEGIISNGMGKADRRHASDIRFVILLLVFSPYRDVLFMAAQGLSIGACLLALISSWYTIILGLPAVVILQVAWCCEMNKCGLNTAGVFMAVSGAVGLGFGGLLAAAGYTGLAVLGFIGGALYIASSVCLFMFTCTPRFDKWHKKSENDDTDVEQGKANNATVANMAAIADITSRPSGDEVSEMNQRYLRSICRSTMEKCYDLIIQ